MARGWESKSVESQQDSAQSEGELRSGESPGPVQSEALRKLECLKLSRTRILHDLDTCTSARYREQLRAALAHIERELSSGG